MPKRACYTLTWSSSNQAYELYEGQEDDVMALVPGTPAWSVWVSQTSSFAFRGQNGSYTARKERKQRGGGYWYAYARVERKLTKRYLGRGTDLTLARLKQVAQAFWSYLLAALQTFDPQLGRIVQTLLHPLQPAALESVLTLLINDLQARLTGDHAHLVLILEDYHDITNDLFH